VTPTECRGNRRILIRWALAILYAAGIFVVSSIPGNDLPQLKIGDKLVHVLVFGGLAILSCRALRLQKPTWSRQAVAVLSVLATVAYGCLDEGHQSFVSERQAELSDVMADGVGALLAGWGWNKAAKSCDWLW
jgi:VanZ family protein